MSINIGTALTSEWMDASILSANAAAKFNKPWVLDPVGVGVTKHRTDHCVELMKKNPTVVRGNASEIMALVLLLTIHSNKHIDSAALLIRLG